MEREADNLPTSGAPGTPPEVLQGVLEQWGLSGHQARTLTTLVQVGSATSGELSRLTDIGRTSIYPVLEELRTKRLAEPLPGNGVACWTSPGREEILSRLKMAEEERLRERRAWIDRRMEDTREAMDALDPAGPSGSAPYVHRIRDAAQVTRVYEQVLRTTRSEVLCLSRPPYAYAGGPNRTLLEALSRGVSFRVVFDRAHFGTDPAVAAYREATEVYIEAGLQARLVDELPIKLLIFDQRVVQIALTHPARADAGLPVFLLVEHPGYAAVQAEAFEQFWRRAQPFPGRGEREEAAQDSEGGPVRELIGRPQRDNGGPRSPHGHQPRGAG